MIRLLACDLDGTLLNDQHRISKQNVEAIKALQASDISFMSATGRNYESVTHLFQLHDIQCEHLLLNGSLIKNLHGEAVYELAMTIDKLHEILQVIHDGCQTFNMYTDKGVVTPNIDMAIQQFIDHMRHHGYNEQQARLIMEENAFCVYEREVTDVFSYLNENPTIYKIETFGGNIEHNRSIHNKLSNISDIAITNSISDNVEITMFQAQKGYALKAFCKARGIALDEVIVMGDSHNDLSMMHMFPNSIAVGNAIDEIKQAAGYVTKANTEHAVAHVIEELLQHNRKKTFHLLENEVK